MGLMSAAGEEDFYSSITWNPLWLIGSTNAVDPLYVLVIPYYIYWLGACVMGGDELNHS